MSKAKASLRILTCFAVLSCTVLVACFLLRPNGAFAQAPPPPNTPTDTATPTSTATPSSTPTPSNTPAPSNTPTATSSTTPTSTATQTSSATPTYAPTSAQPSPEPAKTKAPAKPDPNCQSVVEGYVINAAGQRATGATVHIEGSGWSNAMLTDDNGHYGFGGLCAGTATLTAYLLTGETTQPGQASLNGKDSVRLDLHTLAAGIATATYAPIAQQTPTPEPQMPVTGYSGWLLIGAALLGVLLLATAGARRALSVQQRTRDRD